MKKKEGKEERGKIIYDLVAKHAPKNDIESFIQDLKKSFSIETIDLQRIKQSYFDFILETGNPVIKFSALVHASRKPVRWNSKGLVISKNLVDNSLFQKAIEEKTTYKIIMHEDLKVECIPE